MKFVLPVLIFLFFHLMKSVTGAGCGCPNTYKPICSVSGLTYCNECTLKCRNEQIASCNACGPVGYFGAGPYGGAGDPNRGQPGVTGPYGPSAGLPGTQGVPKTGPTGPVGYPGAAPIGAPGGVQTGPPGYSGPPGYPGPPVGRPVRTTTGPPGGPTGVPGYRCVG